MLKESEHMSPDQLHLDFSVTDMPATKVASVHNLSDARRLRDESELLGVYQEIFDSVKHVRLDRHLQQTPCAQPPRSKR